MKTPYQKTFISELPTHRYRLASPVEVHIFKEANELFRASAPGLGMWMDGFGRTEGEAVEELCNAIIGQRDSSNEAGGFSGSEYARKVRNTFEQMLIQT